MSAQALDLLSASGTQALLEAVAMPAALHLGGRIFAANEALCQLVSRPSDQLDLLSFDELVSPGDKAAVRLAIKACLGGGARPAAISTHVWTPDGTQRPVKVHARPFALGEAIGVILSCVDLGHVVREPANPLGPNQMLHQIIEGAPFASFVIDKNHRITHWNTACERMTGLIRQKMLGSKEAWRAFYDDERPLLADLIVDGVSNAVKQAFYSGIARPSSTVLGGFEVEGFFPQFGKDGMWVFFTASPLHDEDGQVIGAIETLQDVTARRQTEEELLRHRNELEKLVKVRSKELAATVRELEMFVANAPIGVAYTFGGAVHRANEAMAEMLGYSSAEIIGMPGRSFFLSDDDHAKISQLLAAKVSMGEPMRHDMWIRHADGRALWIQIDAHAADINKTSQGTWWMMQDRTNIRAAQEQLQARFEEVRTINDQLEAAQNQLLQQDKMASIGQLAAGVAHEINNPIGFVSSNLNTLRQNVKSLLNLSSAYETALANPDDAAAKTALGTSLKEAEIDYLREDLPQLLNECDDGLGRVRKIVQDLKDFSRVDQANWQEADLNAGLESTLNVVRHEVKYKAEISMQLAPLPPVVCLAAQLNQVFMNLIVNAAHAIPDQGVIALSSGTHENWAWVQVKDSGSGMSEAVRRRIFEPFYTTKDVGKGTGLGLSLSFSIVQKHGGAIRVQSATGKGSAFRVWLPIAGPDSLPPGAVPPTWFDEEKKHDT